MITQIRSSLGWRAEHVAAKILGHRQHVPWDVLWREITTRRELSFEPPVFEVVDRLPEDRLVRMEGGRASYWLPEHTHAYSMQQIYKEVFNPGHPHYYEWDDCRINPGDVVLDAGACEGIFTRFAVDRGAKVLVVEPWSQMADALRRTFAAEIRDGRVHVETALLSDTVGESTIVLNPKFPFEAHEGDSDDPDLVREVVPVETIDRVVARSPWRRCDFLKMDIEGSERSALAGSREVLQRDHPKIAIAVYHHASGYRDLALDLQRLRLGYEVRGKGLQQGPDSQDWRPMLLHATVRRA